ncbi:MAG: D-alanine--D-alanine ligase family protein [Oscillospiraceae bacterium]
MKKTNVLVIFGGKSSEYSVSLKSSSAVLRNIDREKYNVTMLGINKMGKWYKYDGEIDNIENDTWEKCGKITSAMLNADTSMKSLIVLNNDKTFESIEIDVVFPVLHGKNGEDGTMQGLLELSGIPYVGCDHISSGNCMDKELTHIVLDAHGIKTAKYVALKKCDLKDIDLVCENFEKQLGFPMFIKPAKAGSSVGVTKAKNKDELKKSIENAFLHDTKLVAECAIVGKEVECAVLGNDNPKSSILGEIAPTAEFYDFDAKYNDASTGLHIPARIDDNMTQKVRETAVRAYKALGCSGFTRVDFFVTDNGDIILNEPNTIPGFTSISMYPKLWEKTGVPFSELIGKLITFAIEKNKENNNG